MKTTYSVILYASEPNTPEGLEELRYNLFWKLSLPREQVEQILNSLPMELKQTANSAEAQQFVELLRKIGGRAEVFESASVEKSQAAAPAMKASSFVEHAGGGSAVEQNYDEEPEPSIATATGSWSSEFREDWETYDSNPYDYHDDEHDDYEEDEDLVAESIVEVSSTDHADVEEVLDEDIDAEEQREVDEILSKAFSSASPSVPLTLGAEDPLTTPIVIEDVKSRSPITIVLGLLTICTLSVYLILPSITDSASDVDGSRDEYVFRPLKERKVNLKEKTSGEDEVVKEFVRRSWMAKSQQGTFEIKLDIKTEDTIVRWFTLETITDMVELTKDEVLAGESRLWLRRLDSNPMELISEESETGIRTFGGRARAYIVDGKNRQRLIVDLRVKIAPSEDSGKLNGYWQISKGFDPDSDYHPMRFERMPNGEYEMFMSDNFSALLLTEETVKPEKD